MEIENILADSMREIKAASEKINTADYYADGILHCGKCGSPRQKMFKMSTDDAPRLITFTCAKCTAERDAEQKEKARQENVLRLKRIAFPAEAMHSKTFENATLDDKLKLVKVYADNWERNEREGNGLLLYGDVGTGKTYAACAVANALCEKALLPRFTSLSRIMNDLQTQGIDRNRYIEDKVCDPRLLILDDLGVERRSEYAMQVVYDVINARYETGKPLIVTTNLSLNDILHPSEEQTKRLYDRIRERCQPIHFDGGSKRSQISSALRQRLKAQFFKKE